MSEEPTYPATSVLEFIGHTLALQEKYSEEELANMYLELAYTFSSVPHIGLSVVTDEETVSQLGMFSDKNIKLQKEMLNAVTK